MKGCKKKREKPVKGEQTTVLSGLIVLFWPPLCLGTAALNGLFANTAETHFGLRSCGRLTHVWEARA